MSNDANVLDLSYLKQTQAKRFEAHKLAGLPVDKLRKVLDTLYDGQPATAIYLTQIRAFYAKKKNIHREHSVYLYMVRNGLIGLKLVEFFENEGGFLNGLNFLINRMDGRKYTLETIKIDEAL